MVDQDIVQQVEAEGWITPIGRLFKAGVRMMERVQKEREDGGMAIESVRVVHVEGQRQDVEALQKENDELNAVVRKLREDLNQLD